MEDNKTTNNKFFKEFTLVNLLESEALTVWNQLQVGTDVSLEQAEDSVKVLFDKKWIGNLPKNESKIILDILSCGWNDIFEGRICKKDEREQYDQRIHIAVYIKKNSNPVQEKKD